MNTINIEEQGAINGASSSAINLSSSSNFSLSSLPMATPFSVKLGPNNYLAWKHHLKYILIAYGLDTYLFGESRVRPPAVLPNGAPNPELVKWIRINGLLCSWISGSVSEEFISLIIGHESAFDMIQILEDALASPSRARIMDLQLQLQTLKKNNLKMRDYLLKIKNIADNLAAVGKPISPDDLKIYMLQGLGVEYLPLVMTVTCKPEDYTVADVHSLLITNESRFEDLSKIESYSNLHAHSAVVSKNQQPNSGINSYPHSYAMNYHHNNNPQQQSIAIPQAYATQQNYRRPNMRPKWNIHDFLQSKGYQSANSSMSFSPNFRGTSSQNDSRPICQICLKRGHSAAECFKLRDVLTQFSNATISSVTPTAHQLNESSPQAHMVQTSNANQQPTAMPSDYFLHHFGPPSAYNQPPDSTWLLDSGANVHLSSTPPSTSSQAPTIGSGQGFQEDPSPRQP